MRNDKNIGLIFIALAIILLVTLVVVKINTDQEEAFLCQLVETSADLTMDECPAHESNSSWLILAAFAVSFVILGMGLYLFFPQARKEECHDELLKQIDTNTFPEEERKMYELIQHNQGSMYQSDIIKQTQMSKVKVSRVLDRLEGRGVLERKRRGMTNIVILK